MIIKLALITLWLDILTEIETRSRPQQNGRKASQNTRHIRRTGNLPADEILKQSERKSEKIDR